MVEQMPEPRVMAETLLLPNGQVLIINGAMTGVAGYLDVFDPIGQSNADHPAFRPTLYTPANPPGQRFTTRGLPTSTIPRLYHSVASLTPSGNIMIGGSNPNDDVSTAKYPTEFRVEFLNPPYMSLPRPVMIRPPTQIRFGSAFSVSIRIPPSLNNPFNFKRAFLLCRAK